MMLFLAAWATVWAQEGFKITGRLGGTLGGKLLLVAGGEQGVEKLGEATMVNGSFEFSGSVTGMTPVYILTEQQQSIATLMLENLEYEIVAGETGIEVQGGGEAQKVWQQFDALSRQVMREQMKMEQEAKSAYASGNQMRLQALQQQFQKVVEEAAGKQAALIESYKDSPVAAFVIASGMEQLDYASLRDAYGRLGDAAKNSLYGQMVARQIEEFKQVEVGSVAPDFKGVTLNSDTVSLHGVQGKLKLMDFWASWCAPCRAEMPNVKKLYKKYHDKGLEILGISLDKKTADWGKAMREEKLPWVNIIDPESKIAGRYLVKAIPHTVLLDENNVIIAKNLRGKELEKKIAELLK